MKRHIILPLLAIAMGTQAQDSYTNERISNNSGDVIGSARYVGMGGAMGALGADMSVISWNPAGIGLMRKNDISMTFGGTWGKSSIEEERPGKGTIDQAGFVFSMSTGSQSCPYINFAFNFQKKINFNQNFYADNNSLNGLSQMDQVAELDDFSDENLWKNGYQSNLANLAWDFGFLKNVEVGPGTSYRQNGLRDANHIPASSIYTHHSEGSLQSFDFNVSTNIQDRTFIGLTIGVDNMRYRSWSCYGERYLVSGSELPCYDLSTDTHISGTGFNVKLGAIFRPLADNPFRIGFTVETPTWYRLENSTFYGLNFYPDEFVANNQYEQSDEIESLLPFKLRSPWKLRTSMGSTVGKVFAWDIDYEFAAYGNTSTGSDPDANYRNGNYSIRKDQAMNDLTRDNLRATHTLRAGIEVKPIDALAFRLGYNFSSSAYEREISYDQYNLMSQGSCAMDFATSTNYMRMGDTNILTVGAGYRFKRFYIDMAYKIRNQKADFYAFDTNFTSSSAFRQDHPEMADMKLQPTEVDLTRHTLTCTLGFKF